MSHPHEEAIRAVPIMAVPGFDKGGVRHVYWGYDLTLYSGRVVRAWVVRPRLLSNEVDYDAFLLDDGSPVSDEMTEDFLEDILEAIRCACS